MTLKARIQDDMKVALRAKDSARLGTIRLLLAALKQKEVDERVELDDAAVLAIIDKLIKQRRDAIGQFDGAGRTDLADKERAEVDVLTAYLPKALSEDEIVAAIDAAIAASGAAGPAAIGKLMATLKPQLAGRADMTRVSALVKARLSA